MALSSSSLIHLTEQKEALIGILTDNFKVKYCLEKVETPAGDLEIAVPMVSFCDIPMSQIKDHIAKYGSYGIGLKQSWGQAKGLNPVLYIDTNSSIGRNYYSAAAKVAKGKNSDNITEHDAQLLDVLRYMKNYEAPLTRRGQTNSKYRFADEKEWRYVPNYKEANLIVSGPAYKKDGAKEMCAVITENLRLEFEPEDIKYIIIKEDSEVSEFIDILRQAKRKKYSYNDVERLITRIITVEQIMSDF